ncbi:ARID DNA-binding domain-containing protein [Tanacetum coccineum]
MVNYNRVLSMDWQNQKPVSRYFQYGIKSRRFNPWEKSIREHPEDYELRYSLANGTAEIIPKSNRKRQLSDESKIMLKEKLKEIEAFNTSKLCAAFKRLNTKNATRKEKKARCYICKKRGHVLWKCPNKKSKHKGETSRAAIDEELKYPEIVHVKTDYMVEGSDEGSWNKIWYVGSTYKNHMSPVKSLFKRLKYGFKLLDVEEDERKFIFSYGVGEATVETRNGTLVIPNVFYTPEITMNVLSVEQLVNQGYMTTYERDRCIIKYMFDEKEGTVDMEEDAEMDCGDSLRMVKRHNKFLENYFESIDSKFDPKEEHSLIKGMEDLKMEKEDFYDYVDDQYLSMNGTLYAIKVNTFPRFISFLDLIKIDKLVYKNWEVLARKFMEMLEWFYLGYLGQDVLGELPPVIGVTKVDLLGLYKFVDNLGGYMNVSFNNKWNEIAKLLGVTQENQDAIKECYKEYIGMAKIYYEEAKRTKQEKPGDVAGKGSGTAGIKGPQAVADVIAEIGDSLDGTQGRIAQDDVKGEGSNSVWTTDNNEEEHTSSSDGFTVII